MCVTLLKDKISCFTTIATILADGSKWKHAFAEMESDPMDYGIYHTAGKNKVLCNIICESENCASAM